MNQFSKLALRAVSAGALLVPFQLFGTKPSKPSGKPRQIETALAVPSVLAAASEASAVAAIRELLDAQVVAWNRGDIEGFMQGYWKSEQTAFVSSSEVIRGWQKVLERYRRSYPDRKAMGKLAFSELEIRLLSSQAALVLGRWQLERTTDRPSGFFTLVLQKRPEGWRIIHDHTSTLVTSDSSSSHK